MASPPPGRLGFRWQRVRVGRRSDAIGAGMAGRLIREVVRRRGRTAGQRPGARGGGQVLLPTSAVKEVRRKITPKVLAWNRPQARGPFQS
jgi:hypothetical protein